METPGVSNETLYDLLVVGAGCAGLAASIYAKRFNMDVLVVGREFGGLIATTHVVENYPGFPSISGAGLVEEFRKHVDSLSVPVLEDEVTKLELREEGSRRWFVASTAWSGTFKARTVLLATGTVRRKLGVPGEEEFAGRGVSYCATCDGPLFKGKVLAVVGGSDSAAKEALYLASLAKKVYIFYRRAEIRAEPINKDRVYANSKIEVVPNTNVLEIVGDEVVTGVRLDTRDGIFPLDGVFIEIGADPANSLVAGLGVELNEKGEVVIDDKSATNMAGLFAAGDVANASYKQAITGVAEGVRAAFTAYELVSAQNASEGE
ncbi:MAG: thioredoxin-disulfide reductase [Promethearchaeota archaeon]